MKRASREMGMNVSKRVEANLSSSPELESACNSVYDDCLALAQHAFPGIRPYQLFDAASRLHTLLLDGEKIPLFRRWLPSPPEQVEVDSALRRVTGERRAGGCLTRSEFKAFAVELFRAGVLSRAGGAFALWTPAGIAGIAGIGMAAHAGKDVVGKVIGVYAVGLAAAIYATLG